MFSIELHVSQKTSFSREKKKNLAALVNAYFFLTFKLAAWLGVRKYIRMKKQELAETETCLEPSEAWQAKSN